MRKQYIVRLTEAERETLRSMVKKGRDAAYKIRHANVLLAVDADGPAFKDKQAAEAYGCHPATVAQIRRRFAERGLDGALHRKKQERPSRQRRLDGEAEAVLLAQACSPPPEGATCWTLKLLAERLVELEVVESVSDQTVRRTLKKTKFGRISRSNG